jgi:hypothetical protein
LVPIPTLLTVAVTTRELGSALFMTHLQEVIWYFEKTLEILSYQRVTITGRPESDAQSWDSSTWSTGRFGADTLTNTNFAAWGGKVCGDVSTYNWNGYSTRDYDFALYIK